jgi:hypothetical protein
MAPKGRDTTKKEMDNDRDWNTGRRKDGDGERHEVGGKTDGVPAACISFTVLLEHVVVWWWWWWWSWSSATDEPNFVPTLKVRVCLAPPTLALFLLLLPNIIIDDERIVLGGRR